MNQMSLIEEQAPLPYGVATGALLRCVGRTMGLLLQRRIHLRSHHVGMRLAFANGTSARVYRETVVDGVVAHPCTLVVEFRLRAVRGWGHRLFRWESLCNTPLFVGFPGFVSKLWLAHDQQGVYRGIYEWDGAEQAASYARSLWRVLTLVSVPQSIHYVVVPGSRRDEFLALARPLAARASAPAGSWWQPVAAA